MRLDRLLEDVEVSGHRGDPAAVDVTTVTHDSREVAPGALFCCVVGEHADGHDFAPGAVAAGAVALLVERPLAVDVVQVVVPSTRVALGPVAAALWGHPSRAMRVVGVTGTNGKTTTTHLLAAILDHAGRPCGLIGTLSGARTTPEAPELQARLASLRGEGRMDVAMEVSSHALALHRVDGVRFEIAVFTNLGRDHLDFHGTEEEYFRAKAMLFEPERAARAVVNRDDAHGRLLADAARVPTVTYSTDDAHDVVVGATASPFTWEGRPVRLAMGGRFNVANAVAAAAVARELGVDADAVATGLSVARPVPGRFEPVHGGQPFSVVVDYAHTPDGLEQALRAARAVGGASRVLVVFGCGGDRDARKRPLMGRTAASLADVVIVTDDNPRSEDGNAIVAEVLAGVPAGADVVVERDRRAAIAIALDRAAPGDVVLIAGKGHETGQSVGQVTLPFDDRLVASELLGERFA